MANYYHAYEKRYRRVYERGGDFWTAFPQEIDTVKREIDAFLRFYEAAADTAILECGCGEGYLAPYLTAKGYRYTGVDLSPSAIAKAVERVGTNSGAVCRVDDITQMSSLEADSFDMAIDVYCLQMLVTDPDRKAYLSQLSRVLKPGAKMLLLEIIQDEPFDHTINTFEEFIQQFEPDYQTEEPRDIYVDGQTQSIQLTRVPARFDTPEGYRQELTNAGFDVEHIQEVKMGCVIYCRFDN